MWKEEETDASGSAEKFSELQEKLFSIMAVYKVGATAINVAFIALRCNFQDLFFARRTFDNGEEIRRVYLLHTLNHVLKTRARVLKSNSRLTQASREGRELE